MKKILTTIAVTMVLGLATVQSSDARWGRGWSDNNSPCNGQGCYQKDNESDSEARKAFFEETEELRNKLFEKRSEYFAIMDQESPDKTEAEAVWSEMFDIQKELHAKAAAAGIEPNGGRRGYGPKRGGCGGGPRGSFSGGCNGEGCGAANNLPQ